MLSAVLALAVDAGSCCMCTSLSRAVGGIVGSLVHSGGYAVLWARLRVQATHRLILEAASTPDLATCCQREYRVLSVC